MPSRSANAGDPNDPRRTVAIVQARMGSSRLPGKVLLPVAGRPIILYLLERLRRAESLDDVWLATSDHSGDDRLADLVADAGFEVHRGSENDVLDRYRHAAVASGADVIVRVTGDCPLIDPPLVDRVVETFRQGRYDFVSTNHPATFPDGLDTEVFSRDALETAWREATGAHEREHVTPFIWDRPDRFEIGNVEHSEDLSRTERWTLDYPEDFEFLKTVIEELEARGAEDFGMEEVLDLLEDRPEIREINRKYAGVNWYRQSWKDLSTRDGLHTREAPTE